MDFSRIFHGKRGKSADIDDIQNRTNEIIHKFIEIRDELVGRGPTQGLIHLSEIVLRDRTNTEIRSSFDKLVARLYSTVKNLLKEAERIRGDLQDLKETGHEFLLIRNEDVLVGNLNQGFVVIAEQLEYMEKEVDSLKTDPSQLIDLRGISMSVIGRYMEILTALKQLYPVEKQLAALYKQVQNLFD